MSFIDNQSQRNKDCAKVAAVTDGAHLEHAVNSQLDGLMPPRVFSDGVALAATASVHPTRLPSIQASRARRPSPLAPSIAGDAAKAESSLMSPSISRQHTVVGDSITHRARSSTSSAALNTPKAAIITTVPVTTTEAPVNGGVLFVPPTRSSNIRRRPNVKTRRSAKGKKSLASPPLLTGGFMTKSTSRNSNMPPVPVMKSNGEVDMAYYRSCALKLAGMPVDRSPSVQSQEAEIFGL